MKPILWVKRHEAGVHIYITVYFAVSVSERSERPQSRGLKMEHRHNAVLAG